MSVIINLYNQIRIEEIAFADTAYKKTRTFYTRDSERGERVTKSVYYIDVTYKRSGLYFQIPRFKIYNVDLKNNTIVLQVTDDFYNSFIKPLDKHVISSAHSNSKTWFYGKHFTLRKIQNGFVSGCTDVVSEGSRKLLTLQIGKDCKWFDEYQSHIESSYLERSERSECSERSKCNERSKCSKCSERSEIVCILKMEHLQFIDNMFSYNLVIHQAKVYVHNALTEYAIQDSLETLSSESISVN